MDVGASFWAAQHGYGLPLAQVAENVQSQIAKVNYSRPTDFY